LSADNQRQAALLNERGAAAPATLLLNLETKPM
jgi:hypothetical protein